MRRMTRPCLGVALVLLAGTTAQARMSHGYSGFFSLDTVTAVNEQNDRLHPSAIATIFPNPSNPHTTIEYELATANPINLAIFDLRGCRVRVLESGTRPSGRHQTTWDGHDDAGRVVPTGTYFCRLSTPQGSQTRKLTLAR
jgi:hypothetical protein